MTTIRKDRHDVKMTSNLTPTLTITNLMKTLDSIAPRKLKNTMKETKQIICQIALNPRVLD